MYSASHPPNAGIVFKSPVVGRADADEAVAHAWKAFEEKGKRFSAPVDADEAVAHAWKTFQE